MILHQDIAVPMRPPKKVASVIVISRRRNIRSEIYIYINEDNKKLLNDLEREIIHFDHPGASENARISVVDKEIFEKRNEFKKLQLHFKNQAKEQEKDIKNPPKEESMQLGNLFKNRITHVTSWSIVKEYTSVTPRINNSYGTTMSSLNLPNPQTLSVAVQRS